jgi:alkylhydroperoxidase/carboxymuconolactone decarboxylase family protein YurZ
VPAAALAGDDAALARLAREARESGATMHDFDEALYLTAVGTGIPKAIEATRVLLNVFSTQETPLPSCRTWS